MTDQDESEAATPAPKKKSGDAKAPATGQGREQLAGRHFRFGWWAIALFATLGLVLESFNGLRVGWYLDVTNDARRTMLTLSHAHGTLLAIVNVIFAVSLRSTVTKGMQAALPSRLLLGATVLVPLGFLLGGVFIHGDDPGLGVVLVPAGAIALILAAAMIARGTKGRTS